MKDRPHSEAMAELFRSDPTYAAELLAEVRRDDNPAELAILLRQMVSASAGDARLDDAERGRYLPR
ncbi:MULTISPECIES: addiction module antidote protein [Gammaproteobacteria]|uniref:addiction module antidote protein n=1 Tax=Gammaproteobacteria TaxID=1236 RepID=UPI0009411814|nr:MULTISPECIES: addiction module antidote protein [Gammaproteobacteria]